MSGTADSDRLSLLRRVACEVLEGTSVLFAYLYGSEARGEAGIASDVDVAVMFDAGVHPAEYLRRELALGLAFDAGIGGEKADVRAVNSMPLLLRGRVATEGILLYSANEEARVDFETAARDEYFDFLPAYTAYQTASIERMRREAGRGESVAR